MGNELTPQIFILMVLFALGLVCFMISQIGIFIPRMNPLAFNGRGSRPLAFVTFVLLGAVFIFTAVWLSKNENLYLYGAGAAFVLAVFVGRRAVSYAKNNKGGE